MRFWALGCFLIVLAGAGCGDNGGDAKKAPAVAPLTKLKIVDEKVGTGPAAKDGDALLVEYTGKLSDGTVFDSTANRGNAPFSLTLGSGGAIKGYDQGLQGIKEGGKRLLSIPAAMGYGAQATGKIPPNSDLYFEVTVDKIIPVDETDKDTIVFTHHGTGPAAKTGDTLTVKYKGYFVNGTVFDPGEAPLEVKLGDGKVVKGFETALYERQKGDKFTVTIPPQWGYGPQAQGPIPASSWLVFDMEILSIK
jgi:FKBP-type peptidyl-prolyl cis-trans isomerase